MIRAFPAAGLFLALCISGSSCSEDAPASVESSPGAEQVDSVDSTGSTAATASVSESRPYNVVLITLDTLRREHLGCYGYFRDTSPTLDALAAEGIVFERAVVSMSSTLPSHLSMLTGVYAFQHGRESNRSGAKKPFVSSPTLRSVAEFFAEAGYHTGGFVSAPPLGPVTGIQAGFETYVSVKEPATAEETTGRVLKWIGQLPAGEPFFLWVHYWDTHEPNAPAREYAELFERDAAQEAWVAQRGIDPELLSATHAENSRIPELYLNVDKATQSEMLRDGVRVTEDDVFALLNRYDGDLRAVDTQIARVFERLQERDVWDETLVSFTSDHGQELGENAWLGHGRITNLNVFVPWVLRLPPAVESAPVRNPAYVSMVDMMPTILARLDLPATEEFLRQVEGEDVLAAGFERPYVATQRTTERVVDADKRKKKYALMLGRWKYEYVLDKARRLYDLEGEGEFVDVAAEHPDVVERMDGILQTLLARQPETRTEAPSDEGLREALEALEALGYTGD